MSDCPGCGGQARAFVPRLVAAPLVLGLVGAAAVALTKGTTLAMPVLVALGVAFTGLVAWTGRLGLRIWTGQTCASCGGDLPR